MEENGFDVEVKDTDDFAAVKRQYQVPPDLQACHTAIVDGYIVEGHVPAADVTRLLQERPDIVGIAVPGMPLGSPGMEADALSAEAYDVLTFNARGATTLWAHHEPGD